jgi:MFS family permease
MLTIFCSLGLINSAQFLGNLIGLPFTPFASDILGRRAALFWGSLVMCMGIGLQAAAKNVSMFIGARFCSKWRRILSRLFFI